MTELSYLTFWGCERPIFIDTPKDKDLFFPERYQRGLDRIRFVLRFGTGLITVAIPAGHGSSTLARKMFQEQALATHEVALFAFFQKQGTAGWLLPKLALQFGFNPQVESLLKFFDELKEEHRIISLLIDDARKLSHVDALEDLTSLFSLASSALLPVGAVLFGFDPSNLNLATVSNSYQAHISFGAYDLDETKAYVRHRLALSRLDPNLVENEFWPLLSQASQGILSRINRIMESCLMLAADANLRRVTPTMIEVWQSEHSQVTIGGEMEPAQQKLETQAELASNTKASKVETDIVDVAQISDLTKKSGESREKPLDLRSLFLDETGS